MYFDKQIDDARWALHCVGKYATPTSGGTLWFKQAVNSDALCSAWCKRNNIAPDKVTRRCAPALLAYLESLIVTRKLTSHDRKINHIIHRRFFPTADFSLFATVRVDPCHDRGLFISLLYSLTRLLGDDLALVEIVRVYDELGLALPTQQDLESVHGSTIVHFDNHDYAKDCAEASGAKDHQDTIIKIYNIVCGLADGAWIAAENNWGGYARHAKRKQFKVSEEPASPPLPVTEYNLVQSDEVDFAALYAAQCATQGITPINAEAAPIVQKPVALLAIVESMIALSVLFVNSVCAYAEAPIGLIDLTITRNKQERRDAAKHYGFARGDSAGEWLINAREHNRMLSFVEARTAPTASRPLRIAADPVVKSTVTKARKPYRYCGVGLQNSPIVGGKKSVAMMVLIQSMVDLSILFVGAVGVVGVERSDTVFIADRHYTLKDIWLALRVIGKSSVAPNSFMQSLRMQPIAGSNKHNDSALAKRLDAQGMPRAVRCQWQKAGISGRDAQIIFDDIKAR